LEEVVFRFNRLKKSDLFLETLRHMVTAPVFKQVSTDSPFSPVNNPALSPCVL